MPKLVKTLSRVHVPVIINGTELEETRHDRKVLTLARLWDDFLKPDRIDVRPPYQRDEAWSIKKERQFIASCFSTTMAIPPFYLCKKYNRSNCQTYYALDCRQRATAIRNFMNDKFKVEVAHVYDDQTVHKVRLYWSQIRDDETYFVIKDEFLSHEIVVVMFDYMALESQRKVFVALNNGVPLNSDEIVYCNHFLARKVLNHVFDEVCGNLKQFCQSKVRDKIRFAHVRVIHELLLLCGGGDMKQDPSPTGLRAGDRDPSAKLLHNTLSLADHLYEAPITNDVLAMLGIADKLSTLKGLASLMAELFTINPSLGRVDEDGKIKKYVHARNVTDVIGVLFRAIKQGRVTLNQLRLKKLDLVKVLLDYYKGKADEYANQSTSDLKVMTRKYELLERHLKKHKLISS